MESTEIKDLIDREMHKLKRMQQLGCSVKALETELEVITSRIEVAIRSEVDFYGC